MTEAMVFSDRQAELDYRHQRLNKDREKTYQKIMTPVRKLLARLTGTKTFWQSRSLWIDVSDYQPVIDYTIFKEFDGVLVKLCEVDDTTNPDWWIETHKDSVINGAYLMHRPCFGYMFVNTALWLNRQFSEQGVNNLFDDPELNTDVKKMQSLIDHDWQMRALIRSWAIGDAWVTDASALKDGRVRFRHLDGLALDIERSWMSYNEYYNNPSTYRKVPDHWIYFNAKWYKEKISWAMQHGFLPQVPIDAPDDTLMYTGNWFIQAFGKPEFKVFVEGCVSWVAGYYWSGSRVSVSIQQFKDQYLASVPDTWRPTLFGRKVRLVQITGDKFTNPKITNTQGQQVGLDFNVSMLTKEQLYAEIGYVAEPDDPEPPPDPEPVYTTLTMNRAVRIRKEPGTAAVIKGYTIDKEVYAVSGDLVEKDGYTWVPVTVWVALGPENDPYGTLQ